MMITVATHLEAPIKLVFPGPGRGSMLGLGDVVLPGIMMALALRFDLYLHYLNSPSHPISPLDKKKTKKAPYVEATGAWGERFWTWGTKSQEGEETVADAARFKKVYFKASLIGYVIGIITTLVVLNIYKHGQPALFYLVPCVLCSLWGTALVRGELKLMWRYTEDGSLDQDEDEKDKLCKDCLEADKKVKKEKEDSSEVSKGTSRSGGSRDRSSSSTNTSLNEDGSTKPIVAKKDEHAQHVFLFSLTAPKQGKKPLRLFGGEPVASGIPPSNMISAIRSSMSL
jgi:minor histocompatibility antigen H13